MIDPEPSKTSSPLRWSDPFKVRSVWVPPVVLVAVLIVAMTLVYFGSVVNPTGHLHGLPVAVVNHSVVNYQAGDTVSSFMNLRVANIQACYELWSSKGAEFVTPPIDRGAEIFDRPAAASHKLRASRRPPEGSASGVEDGTPGPSPERNIS